MSAFVVSRDHVDALVAAGLKPHPRIQGSRLGWWTNAEYDGWSYLTSETANAVGQMLTDECVRSVDHRYPDGDLPGTFPDGFDEPGDWTAPYRFEINAGYLEMSPVQVLKLIDCYAYQSCEHPEWRQSEAFRYCDALRGRMISCLPGYDEAAWEWKHPANPYLVSR